MDAEHEFVTLATAPLLRTAHGAPGASSSTCPITVTVSVNAVNGQVSVTTQELVMAPLAGMLRSVALRQSAGPDSVIETLDNATLPALTMTLKVTSLEPPPGSSKLSVKVTPLVDTCFVQLMLTGTIVTTA